MVDRSVDESEGNMSLETANWEYSAHLELPLKKKAQQQVEWKSVDLPNIPILVNTKGSKEHTRLVVYQKVPKRQSGGSRSSGTGGSKDSIGSE